MTRGWITFLLVVGCAGGLAEDRGTLDNVPKAAAASLQQQAAGMAIQRVEHETERGVETYEATWYAGGVRHEAKVSADGKLLELEVEVVERDVPAAVRATAERALGQSGAKYERQLDGSYEAEIVVDGKEREVAIDASGKLIRSGDEDEDGDDGGGGEEDDD